MTMNCSGGKVTADSVHGEAGHGPRTGMGKDKGALESVPPAKSTLRDIQTVQAATLSTSISRGGAPKRWQNGFSTATF